MKEIMDLREVPPKKVYPLGPDFEGVSPAEGKLSFTNYYMEREGRPFYGISGEFHYSRYRQDAWRDELLKMKAGGINIVSTYVFWNHHEEREGVFDFSGRRNLRGFIELCAESGFLVIVRIGPFNHGEVRNGGLPDWLYGQPFEVRSTEKGFMECVARLYKHIHEQLEGYYFSQGGPIIAAQLDNEYMHSAAPWEMTTGVSNEWMRTGTEGDTYMLALLDLARKTGIDLPFYTCTGWGGAATPENLMPLWGGYAFRPWIFYSHRGEHPATEEYIYRDNHNNAIPATYNFEPAYEPESRPYLCCEMGGGMTCCYYYRFQLPYESVDAMANIKIGSGCNMLGYYMYHGGTNPTGKTVPFLNEGQVPKLSYDYQAAIGEYGQLRPSYHRLRLHHYLIGEFADSLCRSRTLLPRDAQMIQPEDPLPLRYAVRYNPGEGGFLLINNYQDHAPMTDKKKIDLSLILPEKRIEWKGIGLRAGENVILPFNFQWGGIPFDHALAQPAGLLERDGRKYAFFFCPEGMTPAYTFAPGVSPADETEGDGGHEGAALTVSPGFRSPFTVRFQGKELTVITLTREESLGFYLLDTPEGRTAVMTGGALLFDGREMRVESCEPSCSLRGFPSGTLSSDRFSFKENRDGWDECLLEAERLPFTPEWEETGPFRYRVTLPPFPEGAKEILLEAEYTGDIAHAFINGKMVADNFANGAPWTIGLKEFESSLSSHPLVLTITPLKEGGRVQAETPMAGRREEGGRISAGLTGLKARIVYEWRL